jgi:hypothetical protein
MHTFFNYSTAKSRSNPLRKLLLAGTVFSLALSTSPLPLQARSLALLTAASPKAAPRLRSIDLAMKAAVLSQRW